MDDYAAPAGRVSLRLRLVMLALAAAMGASVFLQEYGGEPDEPARLDLRGGWKLAHFQGRSPEAASLGRAVLDFQESGVLVGAVGIPGALPEVWMGRWMREGDSLATHFGEAESEWSELTVLDGGLMLDPDPLLLHATGASGVGVYRRLGSADSGR